MKKVVIASYAVLDVLLAVIVGIIYFSYLRDMENHDSGNGWIYATIAIDIVSAIVSLVCAVLSAIGIIKAKPHELLGYSRVILIEKLILIPFFIFNFLLWLLITMGLLVVPGLQLFLGIVLICVAWTYIIVLGTSIGATTVIVRAFILRKEHTAMSIICAIAQFIFGIDVIAYLVFHLRSRKFMKSFKIANASVIDISNESNK